MPRTYDGEHANSVRTTRRGKIRTPDNSRRFLVGRGDAICAHSIDRIPTSLVQVMEWEIQDRCERKSPPA